MLKTGLRLVILCSLVWMVSIISVQAQGGNLLRDGDFEGNYTGRTPPPNTGAPGSLNVPGSWALYLGTQPHTESWMNLVPSIFPHPGPGPSPHSGGRALNIARDGATFTVVLYQQVSVAPATNLQASAWAWIKTCRPPKGGTDCASEGSSGASVKVGIDPNGGVDPLNGGILWSNPISPHNQWQQATVGATSIGGTVTVFLYGTQSFPATTANGDPGKASFNRLYWDDAALVVGGAGGSVPGAPGAPTPVPTAPPVVAFVVPQGAQPDGSIQHIVRQGDTIDSIAYAYGVTRADILQLNNLPSPRFISVGQKLIIKQAPPAQVGSEGTAEAGAPEATAVAVQPTQETGQAQPTPDTAQPTAEQPAGATEQQPAPTQNQSAPTQEPAANPSQSPNSAEPAPVVTVVANAVNPAAKTSAVCVSLFNDTNQNRIQEAGELPLAGGKIALAAGANTAGSHDTTDAQEPFCFDNLTSGDYVALAAAPNGYGLTTPNQLKLRLYPGAQMNIAFGAAQGVKPAAAPPPDNGGLVSQTASEQGDTTTSITDKLLGVSGLIVFGLATIVFLGGMGIAFIMRRR